ncbi:type II toxin-antitoxin system VapC family toxin [Leptospira sp. GIMC2001]|uniref:type II toxin-antitoxin system VapC family toxin n=1 Tax=Leptospira sp. GIMC2001 TaxID=1513297 RepID=UPI00234A1192|nr:PIN domain-containing protein [Leptospira sp. GIMC2001]WCL50361.1 PIN domain-containing protein [Leptospira sp. GIMC2001]
MRKLSLLVDTSVWSEALRRKKNDFETSETFLYKLIKNEEEIFLTGSIIQEILSGIKDGRLFDQIQNHLNYFSYLELDKKDYIDSAKLRNELSKKGLSLTTIDCQIATTAINRNLYLATYDNDFVGISKYKELNILNLENYLKIKKKANS